MRKLTLEQKAKRYDYLEKSILDFLEKHIADYKYDVGDDAPYVDVLEEWIDHVDSNDDIVPRGVYLLFDKILDENYGKYMSIGNISIDSYKQEYKEFEEKIGG